MKSFQPLATRQTKISPPQKNICGLGAVYTMENKDTNTDYQKFVRVGEQKWEIVEITVRIIFFWLRFIFTFIYFLYRVFKSHLKKSPPPKKPISTQNPNLTKVNVWPYKHSEFNQGKGGGCANYETNARNKFLKRALVKK